MDFTQFEAGPSCTEALAWLGAEVVKIENPKTGDPGRRLRPGHPDDDPWYFHQFNANKKSLTLNLKSPRGLEIVKELLKKADITVENMAPGTIERLGLGYDAVKQLNPGIVYCQVKGFGDGQPVRKEPRLRHDRAGRGRPDQRHRRRRPSAGQARPVLWRHRHRHADGDQHLGGIAPARPHRQRPAAAGGDAGRDGPLHAGAVFAHPAQRQGPTARRQQPVERRAGALGPLPVQARRAERLCLCLYQPRQSRALDAPFEGYRPRRPDRRPALRHRTRPAASARPRSTRSSRPGPASTPRKRR